MTIVSTPRAYRSMPKHFRSLIWRRFLIWSWIFCRITDVNFFDKPLQRIGFNHGRGWSWLNGRKTVDSRTKTVTGVGSNFARTWRVFADNRWTTGKSWLTCPNFVSFFWNFSNFFKIRGFFYNFYDFSFFYWNCIFLYAWEKLYNNLYHESGFLWNVRLFYVSDKSKTK